MATNEEERRRTQAGQPDSPTQGMGSPSTYAPNRQQRVLTARAVDRAVPQPAIGVNQVQNSMAARALRANTERKQGVSDRRASAAQQRAQQYEARHGRPLQITGMRTPETFAPDAQQRQLVSQGVNTAIPQQVPPTQGGEGHAAADQLPNAPQAEASGNSPARQPTFNDGAGATYTTGTGRTGNLPDGVAVDYREDGTPVFTNSPGSAAAIAQQQPTQGQGQAQGSATPDVQRMLASALQAQQQTQQPAAPRRLSRRNTEPVTGEASRMASMRRNDLAWDMRRMGRGSPSTRRGLMDAYMQEQRLGADAVQGQANRDNQVDMAAMGHQAQAAEGAANRQLTASGQMLTAAQQAEQARQFNMGSQTLTGADGTVSMLRNDGTVAPLQGADGEPFRAAPTRSEGAVTPAIQFQALSQQLRSMQETAAMSPDSGLDQQIQEIQAQMAALAGGGQVQHAAPSEPPAEAIAQLRSNPDAAAQFDEIFGPGAAARYLGN